MQDAAARHRFYIYANWCYQAGVFLSRSSGMHWQPGMSVLWIMPGLQTALLAFFLHDAVWHWWYSWTLLFPCFATGAGLQCLRGEGGGAAVAVRPLGLCPGIPCTGPTHKRAPACLSVPGPPPTMGGGLER